MAMTADTRTDVVRTLVLHVGLPKAGSTSLQDAMANSTELLASNGVLFVRLRPIKLINSIASGNRTDPWPRLLGEDPPDLVVLSSEYLCTLTRKGIEGLLTQLDGQFDRIQVVFVLRQLDDWVRSRINQRAQGLPGYQEAGSEEDPLSVGVGLDVGDPDEWLATWAEWVAADKAVRELTLLPLVGEEPLPTRFLSAIGRPDVVLDDSTASTWSNRSVDERALDLIATTRDMSEVLRERQGLASIRDDVELFAFIKRIISTAKQWERPVGVEPSHASLRAAAKTANAIRDRLALRLEEPLVGQVFAIVGTRESARKARKDRTRPKVDPAAEHTDDAES